MANGMNRVLSGLVGFLFFCFVLLLIIAAIPIILLLVLISWILNIGLGARLIKWIANFFRRKGGKTFQPPRGKVIDAEFEIKEKKDDPR